MLRIIYVQVATAVIFLVLVSSVVGAVWLMVRWLVG